MLSLDILCLKIVSALLKAVRLSLNVIAPAVVGLC